MDLNSEEVKRLQTKLIPMDDINNADLLEPAMVVIDSDSEEEVSEEIELCAICLSPLEQKTIRTPCQHHFHRTCLQRATNVDTRCPCCRFEFPADWLYLNDLDDIIDAETYWEGFESMFEMPQGNGPLLPSQQHHIDVRHELRRDL